jgi:flagellar biosynthesis/type III secretory pathway protein FliH
MSYKARCLTDGDVSSFAWQLVPGIPELTTSRPAAARPGDRDAEERAAAIERDAFAKGYAEGERSGMEAAATRTDAMLRRLGATIDELIALRGEIVRKSERQAVQLVLAIAERIVRREISLDRSILIGMARAALDRLGEHGTATVRLNPADLAAIGDTVDLAAAGVRVVADAVVSRGGCLVQSDFGFMDVSPDAQFRELARLLLADADASPGETAPAGSVVLR